MLPRSMVRAGEHSLLARSREARRAWRPTLRQSSSRDALAEVEHSNALAKLGHPALERSEVGLAQFRVDVDLADAARDRGPDHRGWEAGRSVQGKRPRHAGCDRLEAWEVKGRDAAVVPMDVADRYREAVDVGCRDEILGLGRVCQRAGESACSSLLVAFDAAELRLYGRAVGRGEPTARATKSTLAPKGSLEASAITAPTPESSPARISSRSVA